MPLSCLLKNTRGRWKASHPLQMSWGVHLLMGCHPPSGGLWPFILTQPFCICNNSCATHSRLKFNSVCAFNGFANLMDAPHHLLPVNTFTDCRLQKMMPRLLSTMKDQTAPSHNTPFSNCRLVGPHDASKSYARRLGVLFVGHTIFGSVLLMQCFHCCFRNRDQRHLYAFYP